MYHSVDMIQSVIVSIHYSIHHVWNPVLNEIITYILHLHGSYCQLFRNPSTHTHTQPPKKGEKEIHRALNLLIHSADVAAEHAQHAQHGDHDHTNDPMLI